MDGTLYAFQPIVLHYFTDLQVVRKEDCGQVNMNVELGDMEKIRYHDILVLIPRYRYCGDILGLAIGALTKYLLNDILDK